ncbi:MAG: two pore domain potassium channel family protein, partial [Eubacterium sp.]|nr:two pore domain potassium channel family protein [Eubacterium sp.]
EPGTFNSFFEALYWAAISLTSVGYGDITPVSDIGRLFTIISAIVGLAVIALPSGIITAGYIEILNKEKEDNNNDNNVS